MEQYKTMKQAELEINPPKECKSKKCCKKVDVSLVDLSFRQPTGIERINEIGKLLKQVRELVNTTSNDMLLGEAVRKLFS